MPLGAADNTTDNPCKTPLEAGGAEISGVLVQSRRAAGAFFDPTDTKAKGLYIYGAPNQTSGFGAAARALDTCIEQLAASSPLNSNPSYIVEQICGDQQISGSEACDDGNTLGGDGCSADCSTVEKGFVCHVAKLS